MPVPSSADPLAEARAVFDQFAPLARRIAGSIARQFPRLAAEDIEIGALVGLWQSALKYHALKPAEFTAIACPRIRGACLDVVRSEDFLSRHSRKSGLGSQIRRFSVDALHERDPVLGELSVSVDPTDRIHADRRLLALSDAIDRLPARQRDIVRAILAGEKQRDIGARIKLTEARVNQIWKDAIGRLREDLTGVLREKPKR